MPIKEKIPEIKGIEVTHSDWSEFEAAMGLESTHSKELEHEDFAPTIPGIENLIFSDPDNYS